MGYWIAIAGAIQAAGSAYGSSQEGKAAKENAASIQAATEDARADSAAFTERQLSNLDDLSESIRGYVDRFGGAFDRIFADVDFTRAASPSELADEGILLSEKAFDAGSKLAKKNLDFILGSSQESLRKAQLDFAKLASGDTSEFEREVSASAFGALAESAGLPFGSFANTSAKNLATFRSLGVNASLGISDFIAKEGTIDPPNPINTIFDLARFEQSETARSDEFEFRKAATELDSELKFAQLAIGAESGLFDYGLKIDTTGLQLSNAYLLQGASLAGVGSLANANLGRDIGQGISSTITAYNEGQSRQKQDDAAQAQADYYRSITASQPE